jgi:hypothetical protein
MRSIWVKLLIYVLYAVALLYTFTIINVMVSIKYETVYPGQCISQITGDDLCAALRSSKLISAVSFILATIVVLGRSLLTKKRNNHS